MIIDDFNDGVIDPLLWTPIINGASISEILQTLYVSCAGLDFREAKVESVLQYGGIDWDIGVACYPFCYAGNQAENVTKLMVSNSLISPTKYYVIQVRAEFYPPNTKYLRYEYYNSFDPIQRTAWSISPAGYSWQSIRIRKNSGGDWWTEAKDVLGIWKVLTLPSFPGVVPSGLADNELVFVTLHCYKYGPESSRGQFDNVYINPGIDSVDIQGFNILNGLPQNIQEFDILNAISDIQAFNILNVVPEDVQAFNILNATLDTIDTQQFNILNAIPFDVQQFNILNATIFDTQLFDILNGILDTVDTQQFNILNNIPSDIQLFNILNGGLQDVQQLNILNATPSDIQQFNILNIVFIEDYIIGYVNFVETPDGFIEDYITGYVELNFIEDWIEGTVQLEAPVPFCRVGGSLIHKNNPLV